jgi:hypothetical protein
VQAQVGFVRSLLRTIAGHKPFASGALAAYFEFLQRLPPLPLFAATAEVPAAASDAQQATHLDERNSAAPLDDLLAIVESHISFQLSYTCHAPLGSTTPVC